MAKLKTTKNNLSVTDFLNSVEDKQKRDDCWKIYNLMKDATHSEASMWGESIVDFGSYNFKYASGRDGDWFLTGFSPRKQIMTLYLMRGAEKNGHLRKKLGKHSTGKSCLYVKKLEDVDLYILRELITSSIVGMTK